MTIPIDIILAFILLVIFNFAMNLFLFYKWHKLIEEYSEVKEKLIKSNLELITMEAKHNL